MMIEFFEFLNTVSPMRATLYLGFILVCMFSTYTLIDSIIGKIFSKSKSKDEDNDYVE